MAHPGLKLTFLTPDSLIRSQECASQSQALSCSKEELSRSPAPCQESQSSSPRGHLRPLLPVQPGPQVWLRDSRTRRQKLEVMQAPLWLGWFKPISLCIWGTHLSPQTQMAKAKQSRR